MEDVVVGATLDGTLVRLEATNVGTDAVHVFDCDAMPYLLADDDGLLVLHGMHEPPEGSDYWGIEIPNTRPLEPGEVLRGSVDLGPGWVHSHYGTGDALPDLPARIRTALGWGTTPLDDRAVLELGITQVCRVWQHLTYGPELHTGAGVA